MLTGLWAFFLGSPVKIALWVGNRLLTWTGLFVVWKKLEGATHRPLRFLAWMFLINLVSLTVLVLVLRASHH